MKPLALQDLRRVVAAVAKLQGRTVEDVTVRSDLRHLKIELGAGMMLVVAAERDGQGRPYLEVDVIEAQPDLAPRQQIEVHFD